MAGPMAMNPESRGNISGFRVRAPRARNDGVKLPSTSPADTRPPDLANPTRSG